MFQPQTPPGVFLRENPNKPRQQWVHMCPTKPLGACAGRCLHVSSVFCWIPSLDLTVRPRKSPSFLVNTIIWWWIFRDYLSLQEGFLTNQSLHQVLVSMFCLQIQPKAPWGEMIQIHDRAYFWTQMGWRIKHQPKKLKDNQTWKQKQHHVHLVGSRFWCVIFVYD